MLLIDSRLLVKAVNDSMLNNPHKEKDLRQNHRTEHLHFISMIKDQPVVDPITLPKGKWVKDSMFKVHCSNCNATRNTFLQDTTGDLWNFCPKCSADMRKVIEDE